MAASVRVTGDKAPARILAEAGLSQAAAELRAVGDPSLGEPSGSEDVRYRVLDRRRTAIDLE